MRELGHRAVVDHDPDIPVLDLVFDSIVDGPTEPDGDVRNLAFGSGEDRVEVCLRGVAELDAEVVVRPAEGAVLEVRRPGAVVAAKVPAEAGAATVTALQPGLATFVVYWPEATTARTAVRTAWVSL